MSFVSRFSFHLTLWGNANLASTRIFLSQYFVTNSARLWSSNLMKKRAPNVVILVLQILDWLDCASDQQCRGTDQALALHHSHIQVTLVTLGSHSGHCNNIPLCRQWVSESLIVSDLEIAIPSPSFTSLFELIQFYSYQTSQALFEISP